MSVLIIIQIFFSCIIGLYFFNMLRSQHSNKAALEKESKDECEKLSNLKKISLSKPLSEKTRPTKFEEIIGQEQGLKALQAALCGPNPQHVIIYGPPGVGKTAAARVVLEEAKKMPHSPFEESAKFIETDATTLRFDERGIADPLIGSVHDPIYQGAGAYGYAGIPQPKMGAVTKAHGGVLFIDEIGELHPMQINKLLKVLEDRKVYLESAYYSSHDSNIPAHIHDIFQNGLPADFRLVGATTRDPEELPPAIRSRCLEIFFKPLNNEHIKLIAANAAKNSDIPLDFGVGELISKYTSNGRDAVNMVQISSGIAVMDDLKTINKEIVEWVIEFGQYCQKNEKKVCSYEQVGCVNGLAVHNRNMGLLMEIEVTSNFAGKGRGELAVTGIIEQEEFDNKGQKSIWNSTAKASIENMLTVLTRSFNVNVKDYDIHINFPGGTPVDGPSAGIAIFVAVYSAIKNIPIDSHIAMTGELSIRGLVKPVGGVVCKIEAARQAGVKRVFIPIDNWQVSFKSFEGIEIIPIKNIFEVINYVFNDPATLDLPKENLKLIKAKGLD